ncbi:MAG: DUF3310 domain-containing protein [Desulfurellales bacterium]|nr:MAG: DUF3310 domain-containing protein [Desulfurellales bacterium]
MSCQNSVDHPSHYQSKSGIEVIDVIEAFGLGFRLGNAVKYILRSGKKGDKVEDLHKALWHIQREIEKGGRSD